MDAGMARALSSSNAPKWFWPALLAIAAAMLLVQLSFLPYPGLQADEVVFVTPFIRGNTPLYAWHFGSLQIPVMSVDYLGTLKSLLYWPVFKIWAPNHWSIRVPVCIVSIGTLLVFGSMVRRAAGPGVAILACLLLASDCSFIFVNVFDWGPVSLLLFAIVAVIALTYRFLHSGRVVCFALAGLVAGLATWYKAAFIFPLAGMTGAFLLLCRKQIFSGISPKAYAAGIAAFLTGISPLMIYNAYGSGATLKAASQLESGPAAEKLMMLRLTLEGRSLEHYLFRSVPGEKIALQGAPLADLVMRWYSTSRLAPGSALFPALLLSLVALPFLSSSSLFRPLTFTWSAFFISFLFMLTFRNAGEGPHHAVLLYPAPHFIVAATAWAVGTIHLNSRKFASHSRKFAIVAVALIVASNAWLLERYYSAARHNGFSVYWSDGLSELARAAQSRRMPAAILDWGIENGIRIESRGSVPITDDLTPRAGVSYIQHCPEYVIDVAAAARFNRLTEIAGLGRYEPAIVRDHQGTAVYCLFSLQ
jgi:Dolichyl-phosphate-mannose-protein mannosyltransferase